MGAIGECYEHPSRAWAVHIDRRSRREKQKHVLVQDCIHAGGTHSSGAIYSDVRQGNIICFLIGGDSVKIRVLYSFAFAVEVDGSFHGRFHYFRYTSTETKCFFLAGRDGVKLRVSYNIVLSWKEMEASMQVDGQTRGRRMTLPWKQVDAYMEMDGSFRGSFHLPLLPCTPMAPSVAVLEASMKMDGSFHYFHVLPWHLPWQYWKLPWKWTEASMEVVEASMKVVEGSMKEVEASMEVVEASMEVVEATIDVVEASMEVVEASKEVVEASHGSSGSFPWK